MRKKKELKTYGGVFRTIARFFVITIPTAIVLLFLFIFNEISWLTSGIALLLIFSINAVITKIFFREPERFITYLRHLAQGADVEPPRFHKGIFGSFRLADAFQSVKNRWSNQTLSDALILENLPVPLIMMDESTTVVLANQTARSFFGDTILRQTIATAFSDDTINTHLNRIISGKSDGEWFEWVYQDDQAYTFQARLERLPAPAKNGATIVMTLHDITPFKRFKQQQSDFFANASHELKTPLAILSGFIETLQGPAKDDEAARDKFLTMMAEQTGRMTHLVQDLLKTARLQMTEQTNQRDVILLPDLLQSVVEGLHIRATQNNKTLTLKIVHDLPRLMGNRSELHQVFQNLIDNAIKYGEPHSDILIKAHLCNGFPKKSDRYFSDMRQVIAISVHNTGNPIPSLDIDKLFDRFYRINSPKSRHIEGTGLGLGIAQQIVNRHDGLIDVTSSASKGTTFCVYLPIDF